MSRNFGIKERNIIKGRWSFEVELDVLEVQIAVAISPPPVVKNILS